MSEEYKTYSTRLFESERRYLDNHFDGKFSEYVHNSFKRDIEMSARNNKADKRVKFMSPFVMICFGFILIMLTWSMSHLFGKILTLLLGVYLLSHGVYNFMSYVKEFRDA